MSIKALNLGSGVTYRPSDVHGYPGGDGVVFSNDPGQLTVGSDNVHLEQYILVTTRTQLLEGDETLICGSKIMNKQLSFSSPGIAVTAA